MRSPLVLLVCGLLGCAADTRGASADIDSGNFCLYGLRLRRDLIADLRGAEPPCTSDADCVFGGAKIEGSCGTIAICGDVMHRAIAATWDPQAVGEEMCMGASRTTESCSIESSCPTVRAMCRESRCVIGDDLDELLDQRR